MFQCEVCLGHPACGGYSVHALLCSAARSPDEEGGVGAGLEPGRVPLSHLPPSIIVKQPPAALTKDFTRGIAVSFIGASTTHHAAAGPRQRVRPSVPHHGG